MEIKEDDMVDLIMADGSVETVELENIESVNMQRMVVGEGVREINENEDEDEDEAPASNSASDGLADFLEFDVGGGFKVNEDEDDNDAIQEGGEKNRGPRVKTCKRIMPTKRVEGEGLERIDEKGVKWYYCAEDGCTHKSRTRISLAVHHKTAHGIDPELEEGEMRCPRKGCDFKTRNEKRLEKHVQEHPANKFNRWKYCHHEGCEYKSRDKVRQTGGTLQKRAAEGVALVGRCLFSPAFFAPLLLLPSAHHRARSSSTSPRCMRRRRMLPALSSALGLPWQG
jgi:hypothetical protein